MLRRSISTDIGVTTGRAFEVPTGVSQGNPWETDDEKVNYNLPRFECTLSGLQAIKMGTDVLELRWYRRSQRAKAPCRSYRY